MTDAGFGGSQHWKGCLAMNGQPNETLEVSCADKLSSQKLSSQPSVLAAHTSWSTGLTQSLAAGAGGVPQARSDEVTGGRQDAVTTNEFEPAVVRTSEEGPNHRALSSTPVW